LGIAREDIARGLAALAIDDGVIDVSDSAATQVSQAAPAGRREEAEPKAALEEEKEHEKAVDEWIDELEGLNSDDDQLQKVYDESKKLAELDASKKNKDDAELEQAVAASQKSCMVRRRAPSSSRDPTAAHSWDMRSRTSSIASRKSTGTIVSKKSQPEETPERQRGRRRAKEAHCWSPKGTTFVGGRQSSQLAATPSPSPSPPATQQSPSESPLDVRRRRARPQWQRRARSAKASSDSERSLPRAHDSRGSGEQGAQRRGPRQVGATGGSGRRSGSLYSTPEKMDVVQSVKGAHVECSKTVQASSVPNN